MNEDMNGNRKLFWKEVSIVKRGKVESCSRIKNENGRLALGEDEVRRIWKVYFKSIYRDRLQFICVPLVRFREAANSEESRLGELMLR